MTNGVEGQGIMGDKRVGRERDRERCWTDRQTGSGRTDYQVATRLTIRGSVS